MAIPADRRRSYLARQVGSLALSQVRVDQPMARVRAAAWHNEVLKVGLHVPLFVLYDLGLLLTLPGGSGLTLAGPDELRYAPDQARQSVAAYAELLSALSASEVVARASHWRLKDDLVAVLLARILGDVVRRWPGAKRSAGATELPLDPELYADADVGAHFQEFDAEPWWSFLSHVGQNHWHILTAVEQVDLDTLRLLGLFRERADEGGGAGALDLVDLFLALRSPLANDVVNFSLELLPSILETKRQSGIQAFAVDGYASLERHGSLDSLVLSEFAHDPLLFEVKAVENELYYYGHEKQREEERRLRYILVDASASMRGRREVFARGLALTLAKKLSLEGDETWLRFFDSRLYDVLKVSRAGHFNLPHVLCFRSERGRNYGKVFRQLLLELGRLRREGGRRVLLYVITHGQCHIPIELVVQLKRHAYLYGVIILPSSEVTLEYLSLFDQHQIVSAETLGSRADRREKALEIVKTVGPA
jgi:hypothetical protein